MDPILVPNSGKCNFRHSNLVTFWHFYNPESSYLKIRSISVVSRVRSLILPGLFRGNECELILTKLKSLLTRILLSQSKIPKMYDPIVVTLLKMQPRYGQFSGTSLFAYYYKVTPPWETANVPNICPQVELEKSSAKHEKCGEARKGEGNTTTTKGLLESLWMALFTFWTSVVLDMIKAIRSRTEISNDCRDKTFHPRTKEWNRTKQNHNNSRQ